ncbi:MAG: hypothetical protein MUC28_01075 [Planctomycetes bacterium]|nr:hypothetical protein [Planctomycetota bacterium]
MEKNFIRPKPDSRPGFAVMENALGQIAPLALKELADRKLLAADDAEIIKNQLLNNTDLQEELRCKLMENVKKHENDDDNELEANERRKIVEDFILDLKKRQ